MEDSEVLNESVETRGARSKSQKAVSQIVITAMMLAISIAIKGITELIPVFNWPLGGSVSLAMVPLVLTALICGPIYGTAAGVAFGIIDFFFDGVIGWTPNVTAVLLSLLLDYVIGFGACGLAGLFRKQFYERKVWVSSVAMTVAGVVRFFSSFLSGVIVFTSAFDYGSSSGLAVDFTGAGMLYSFNYNIGYMLPTIGLSILVLIILIKPVFTVLDYPVIRPLTPKNITVSESTKNMLPSFEALMPLNLSITGLLAIAGMIAPFQIFWFGYISGLIAVTLGVYEVIMLVSPKNADKDKTLTYIFLGLAVLVLALSVVAVISPYTYGASFYPAE